MAKTFRKELERIGPVVIMDRNPSKDFTSQENSPETSFTEEDRMLSSFVRRCRSVSPPKDDLRPRNCRKLSGIGPVRPKRAKREPLNDDAFTGIIGGSSTNANYDIHSFQASSSEDEDLSFYKEKYQKLIEAASGTGLISFDSDEE
jgi:hypothetical protein